MPDMHKLCPFCGGEPQLYQGFSVLSIQCKNCEVTTKQVPMRLDPVKSWAEWDRRPAHSTEGPVLLAPEIPTVPPLKLSDAVLSLGTILLFVYGLASFASCYMAGPP